MVSADFAGMLNRLENTKYASDEIKIQSVSKKSNKTLRKYYIVLINLLTLFKI